MELTEFLNTEMRRNRQMQMATIIFSQIVFNQLKCSCAVQSRGELAGEMVLMKQNAAS